MTYRPFLLFLFSLLVLKQALPAQTIAEKKAGSTQVGSDLSHDMQNFLVQLNKELKEYHDELDREYCKVCDMYEQQAPEDNYQSLLRRVNEIKEQIQQREKTWSEMAIAANSEEGYALWHQPDTSLGQLVMDYGSQNYVYLLTPEIAQMKISVDSNLPIPRASWNEMLELILAQNGVGIKQLNPYLRQLYLIKEDKSNIRLITNKRCDLEIYPSDARICYVLTPEPSDVRRIYTFLDKFANPNSTCLQMVGRDVMIIAQVAEVQELLKLHDFIATNRGDKEYKAVPLTRVNPQEMSKILAVIFDQLHEAPKQPDFPPRMGFRGDRPDRPGPPMPFQKDKDKKLEVNDTGEGNGLRVIALGHIAHAIFLVGTKEEIKKAEQIIRDVENQVGEAREKVIYWYTVKNSEAEELANVLERVYALMVKTGASLGDKRPDNRIVAESGKSRVEVDLPDGQRSPPPPPPGAFPPPPPLVDFGYYLDDRRLVNPDPSEMQRDPNEGRNNFIVDPKTGAIVMVVEADILPKLKELLRRLDVPKKMVQVEVLLFEKKIKNNDIFGLNCLRIGDAACNVAETGLAFCDKLCRPEGWGVTQFFLSRKKTCSGIPAYDLVYKFLLSQEDVSINASPSVLTLNQTPARIDIEEEISVNTGVYDLPTVGGIIPKDSFARARYGIKINVTPTIHVRGDDEDGCFLDDDMPDYVTLASDITFETIQRNIDALRDRPDVCRRIVNNTVNLPDGQSVIIGGLRRKETDDTKEAIPFLGELPGIGKLFSQTHLRDDSTEMFIVITPKIVVDPVEQLERIKLIEAGRRPGDVPSFLAELEEARQCEKSRLMQNSITLLFGRQPERIAYPIPGDREYDGRY